MISKQDMGRKLYTLVASEQYVWYKITIKVRVHTSARGEGISSMPSPMPTPTLKCIPAPFSTANTQGNLRLRKPVEESLLVRGDPRMNRLRPFDLAFFEQFRLLSWPSTAVLLHSEKQSR